ALFAQTIGGGGGVVIAQPNQRMSIGGNNSSYSPSAFGGSLRGVNQGTATTQGKGATGLTAQSVGGGGGAGGQAAGLIDIGGVDQTGGDAGLVDIAQNGSMVTTRVESIGVLAQSIGGGEGDGGDGITTGPGVSVAIGERGGSGGKGGLVAVR